MDSIYKLGILFSVIDQVSGPTRKIMNEVVDFEKNIQKAKGMVDFGQRMAVSGALVGGAAQQMRGVLGSLIEPVSTVNDSLAALSTVTTSTMGDMTKSMNLTKKAAIDWEKNHRELAEQFIGTSYMMASAGLNDVQSVYGTQTALRVATATFGDHAEAANLIATAYNNMGDKNANVQREMGKLGDMITKTQQTFQFANLNQLSEGLKYAMPAAIQARMEFAEVNAVIGQLNNAGLQGSMAGTAFAATMRQMNKASSELGFTIARNQDGSISFIGTLENIRNKYGDLSRASPAVQMAFQKAFGEEGLRSIVLLNKQTDIMKDNLDKVRNSSGAAALAQAQIEGTETNDYQITMNNLRSLRREAGEELLPTIKELIPVLRNLITSFSGFVNAHPQLTKTLILMFAVGTAVLSILAPILMVAASFIMLSGYGIMAYSKLGQGFTWLYNTPIKKGLIPGMKYLRILFIRFGTASLGIIRSLGGRLFSLAVRIIPMVVSGVWAFTAALLANPITWVVIGVIALTVALYALYKNWDLVKKVAGNVLQYMSDKVTATLGWLGGKVTEFKDSGAALLGAFTDGIKSMINQPVELVKTGLEKVRNLLPFSDAKEGPLSTLTKSGMAMIDTFGAGIQRTLPRLHGMMTAGFGDLPVAAAGGYGQVKVPVSDFFSKEKSSRTNADRPAINIYGDIIIKAEKLDDEESVYKVFRRLAKEVAD